MMRKVIASISLILALLPAIVRADSAIPVEKRTYSSEQGHFVLIVDPRLNKENQRAEPLLTLQDKTGQIIWERTADDFAEFRYPMHACLSDDGQFIVFGGYSAHNFKDYSEGLRFYNRDGNLIRWISRLDLPRGQFGISTAAWYDEDRSSIRNGVFRLFTPGRAEPLDFDLETGELLSGSLTPGQGNDEKAFQEMLENRNRGPNLGSRDRDPRERGPRPLNSDR